MICMSRIQKVLLLLVFVPFLVSSSLLFVYPNRIGKQPKNKDSNKNVSFQSEINKVSLFPSSNIELKNETNYEVNIDISIIKSLTLENIADITEIEFPSIIVNILNNPLDQRINYRIQSGNNGYYMGYGSEIKTNNSLILYIYANDENSDKFTNRLNYALISSIFLVRFPYKSISDLESVISGYYQQNLKNQSFFILNDKQ